ncbi:LytR/AlgR family response regulator transcription factor [Pedobacter rhodius]|uniref:LytTR family DNA-binding domain-containing protein n=1 Tax=Pedobacter rhodius TaxID=3004098 RepID=A0ABT4KYI9_9SPHI|nr:LytTR family DNA-binding domain-containing protein [Pedobacter sp. SJ11]MCZ4222928.1 LytTR family DNA-binding domain-containing protein [Pedobacter sp. SJ11]
MMMNCLLLDDEKPALELLEDNVNKIPFLKVSALCRNPLEALNCLNEQKIDLLFTDIHMPLINGLDFLKLIPLKPIVIIVTAYEQYALESFDLDVVDYLVKPVPFSRFLRAAEKAKALYNSRINVLPHTEQDYFFVSSNYAQVKIIRSHIAYIEGLKDYVKINLEDGNVVVTRMGLADIQKKLGSQKFLRVHKSFIIAVDKIQSAQRMSVTITGKPIPVGQGYRDMLEAYVNSKSF